MIHFVTMSTIAPIKNKKRKDTFFDFVQLIQKEKMRELWDNKEDEIYDVPKSMFGGFSGSGLKRRDRGDTREL